jgi:SPP1 gp7 family putative phage head morphogenesis protein
MGFNVAESHVKKLGVALRKIAKIVGGIIDPHIKGAELIDKSGMMKALEAYAEALGPYALTIVSKILKDISKNNEKAWIAKSKDLQRGLTDVKTKTEIGAAAKALQNEQVALIKSLPIEAGERAQKLAMEATLSGERASVVAEQLMKTTEVTENRATLIARTEIARANAVFNQVRAMEVGVTHYVWRTMEDADVRDQHANLDGLIFAYDDPPDIPGEGKHHPGEIWNCRCYADPVIP